MTTSSTETQHKARTAAMPFIMLTVLIDMISIGLIVPVLPALVGKFAGSQADTAFWYGAVAFAFGLANFFGAPILGALSDKYGRRPILLLGFCGLALNFFATAFSTALWMLIVVRLVGGAMQANAAVCNAYVADITPPEQRAKRFGMIGAMFGVGFIIGPVMGGLLGAINLRLPFIVAGSLALTNLAYGYFVLPESLPVDRRRSFSWKFANPLSSLQALSRLKTVGPLVAVIACSGLAQFVLFTTWVLYTTFKFDWGPLQNGQSLAAVGIMSVLVQGVLLGQMLKRLSPQRLAIIGLLSSTAAYLLWGVASHGWMMYAIIFANIFGPTVNAAIQSIISGAADSHNQGQTLGAVSSLNSLMAVVAPVIGAPLLGAVSSLPKGDWRIGAPFYFCAALQLASLVLAFLHFQRQRQPSEDTTILTSTPETEDV
ncbi:Tetracycline-efflux transporter [Collimonas arenae]|uniref:Tetracycline-efflux transporter n=1 Tax=Collimonas arenae TaxID=279058 RepID=A0A0A1FCP6_9BURK|nr:tetracycline resistance MFS efflux pump [Collimonas arenae]AIY41560.1 Tetracycline-efflux transporter [Collimonas arenae]